jgi:Tfp pilus assembly protein PilV
MHRGKAARRGVSLIEALVAMAVMAFGMLGVLGLQSTLRANADLSKQRSEATRLAEEKIEAWRSFSVIPATPSTKAYADILAGTTIEPPLASFVSNTTYTRTTTVTDSAPVGHKTLLVDVTWTDRAGATQNVRLFSVAAQAAPGLAAAAVQPSQGLGGVRNPGGRARGIPRQAVNFGDGRSGFRPPQPPGGTVAWVFNNVTGVIVSVCTTSAADNASLTLATLSSCDSTQAFQLISGFIRFDDSSPPTATSVVDPTGAVPGTVLAEVVQTLPTAGTRTCFHEYAAVYAAYFCAVPVAAPTTSTPSPPWSGTLQINPTTLPLSATLADVSPANRKVCRYRALTDPVPNPIYQNTNTPLANENLVIITAGSGGTAYACPNPPTRAHQPAT